ncbi:Transmembrane protein [Orchesella cincta]|uniref:Transmembrane protein n=1 Tax=Orchesella cincta TaxID=48709 RepID=A0A1D2MS45_ORCCI|nr:Transmembrane protein [Orchesella cincta]
MGIDFLAYGYAALVATGGVVGYAKAGSTASLGVGILFGAVLAYGAYQTSQNPSNYLVGLGASALLAGVMGNRFYHSGKFMPAGMIAAVSTAMVLRYVMRSFAIKQQ